MPCPAVLERTAEPADATTVRTLPPCVSGDPICPMTGTTTCTDNEDLQRKCPSC
jgi:hypothetical protein